MRKKDPGQNVFRDLIEEQGDRYTVSYQPADVRSSIAILSLFFPDPPKDATLVFEAMENEFQAWLKRFPTPVKVAAYDGRMRLIRLSPIAAENYLMGYIRMLDEAVVRRRGLLQESEIPGELLQSEHLNEVYKSIPCRVCDEERAKSRYRVRHRIRSICFILFLMLVIPGLIQAVIHLGQEFGMFLILISVAFGAYKGMGLLGLRRPSRREKRKADLVALKEHYFYHCEKSPDSFLRLEKENLMREVSQENEKSEQLLRRVAVRRKRPRSSWIAMPSFFRRGFARP